MINRCIKSRLFVPGLRRIHPLVSAVIFILILAGLHHPAQSQTKYIDSLIHSTEGETEEGELMRTYTRIGHYFQDNTNPKAIDYYQKALVLAQKLDETLRVGNTFYSLGYSFLLKGEYDDALDYYLQSARIYEGLKDSTRLVNAWLSVANVYTENRNFEKTDEYHEKAEALSLSLRDSLQLCDISLSRGVLADQKGDYEKALAYFEKSLDFAEILNENTLRFNALNNMGLTYKHQKLYDRALEIFERLLSLSETESQSPYVLSIIYNNIASTYTGMGKYSLAEETYNKSIKYSNEGNATYVLMENYHNLSEMYEASKDFEKQAFYLTNYYNLKDSLFSNDSKNKIVQLEANYQIEQKNSEILQKEVELSQQRNQRNILILFVLAAILTIGVITFFFNRLKTAKSLLEEKNAQINVQKNELESTLKNLQITQAQLIQSEKMASLGELTAGIAHEIQNPLNFVNNFSDISTELIDEMKVELDKGDKNEAIVIANDIKLNLEKIVHHGKRADAIVKGMLQHSRSSSATKEPTDINKLADEYLRLAYHGIRAKDKSFNAIMNSDFDEGIGNINIVPQDIGRVILNLITNAFYAVHEKKKSGAENYEPTVSVNTRRANGKIEITVADNGNGIPNRALDKIFQPFFTTKPSGQGTGLGLSLSYDIVKAHGGELKVETKEWEGTKFTIILPTQK